MAGIEKGGVSSKKEADEVPVAPCKGWTDPCEFCDKRFSQWVPADEESLEKIPSKPGILMLSLKNKSSTETVTITVNQTNIQNQSYNELDILREKVSDRKTKLSKSSILARWMVFKKVEDKDVCTLFAHWFNYSVLPKYIAQWPGENVLQASQYLVYSAQNQKWCYPRKEAVWKKTKQQTPLVVTELVEGCNFLESCIYCDDYFTPWKPLSDVIEGDLAPSSQGICMFSVKYRKKREVIFIESSPKDVAVEISSAIKQRSHWVESVAKDDKFLNPANNLRGTAEVRWLVMSNPNDENSCFLYAHWLNADTRPMMHAQMGGKMPGEKVLERTKQFVLRNRDQKWAFELFAGKPNRFSKIKKKRDLLNQIEDERPDSELKHN